MSRNLGRTDCDFCRSKSIVIEEAPRLGTPEDLGRYFEEFQGCTFASAHCADCEAKYLAWFDWGAHNRKYGFHSPREFGPTHGDLSFRSTFNDEPGIADLPKWNIEVVRQRHPLLECVTCGVKHAECVPCCYARSR